MEMGAIESITKTISNLLRNVQLWPRRPAIFSSAVPDERLGDSPSHLAPRRRDPEIHLQPRSDPKVVFAKVPPEWDFRRLRNLDLIRADRSEQPS
jgi:hypothetical protein